MQLRLYLPSARHDLEEDPPEVVVRSERDITTAGFAAARALREWLRSMPFVPGTSDLHFHVSAEVVSDEEAKEAAHADVDGATPKRKRKAKK